MPSEREIFGLSGPIHLTALDWTNPIHRRSVAASLVRGVYIQERDRQQSRRDQESPAPPWWEFFNFQLKHVLLDPSDLSIFAAIYEFNLWNPHQNHPGPPKYVVAFRGTIRTVDTRFQDLKLGLSLFANKLQDRSRFNLAMSCIHDMVKNAGAGNIWLAGHSLGSAIGILAGKNIVRKGLGLIESYFFNPPFISSPIRMMIKNERLNHGIRFAKSFLTAGVVAAIQIGEDEISEMGFNSLSEWIPYLFVNSQDPVCMEYVGYFQHRMKMEEGGLGGIGRLATQHSILGRLIGGKGVDGEAAHLLPSAILIVNSSDSSDFKTAHGIDQWWKPQIQCESKLYKFT